MMEVSYRAAAPRTDERPRRQVDALNSAAWNLLYEQGSQSERALQLIFEAREIANHYDYVKGLADTYRIETLGRIFRSEYPQALEALWQALQLYQDEGDVVGEAYCYTGYGMVYGNTGDVPKAISCYLRALETLEQHPDSDILGIAYLGIGNVYMERGDPQAALQYFNRALGLSERVGSLAMQARVINAIGALHLNQGRREEALEYCLQSLCINEKSGNKMGISRALHDLGKIHQQQGEPEAARHYFEQAMRIRREIGYPQGLVSTLIELGQLLNATGDTEAGMQLLYDALAESQRVNFVAKEAASRKALANAYKAQGKHEEALRHHEAYHELQLRTQQNEARSQIEYIRTSLQIEKAQREKEMLRQRNVELERLNRDLEQALEMIHDSLNYARRIQNVILPPDEQLQADFADSFIFYRPREIVSGDFYWHLLHESQQGDSIYLAVVDCTGHGVPGAFMSMLGHALLNQLIRDEELSEPAAILTALDAHLTDVLRQRDDLSDVHDGMDAALVRFEPGIGSLTFAGANLPLTRIRDGLLEEWSGNRHPLGGSQRVFRRKQFTSQTLDLRAGDQFYLYSDGFRDQFGLSDQQKRKYSRARFHALLERVHPLPMPKQRGELEAEFLRWKGALRQVDDVVVLGVKW